MAQLPAQNPHERRAQALAEISQMQEDLAAAHKRIEELEQALLRRGDELTARANRLEDQLHSMTEDRDRYRAQAELFHRNLIELATVQANVCTLLEKSKGIVMTVEQVMGDRSHEYAQKEQESAREIIQTVQKVDPIVPRIEAPMSHLVDENLETNIREMLRREPPTRDGRVA